jgi:hypothetical protein
MTGTDAFGRKRVARGPRKRRAKVSEVIASTSAKSA